MTPCLTMMPAPRAARVFDLLGDENRECESRAITLPRASSAPCSPDRELA
jgi:hypothetical protein